MLLFHNYKGATKTLAILATATRMLQRKHGCSLLCQVGFTVHDPLRMRLLAKLWPYAGVLHPNPTAAAAARARESHSTGSTKGLDPKDLSAAALHTSGSSTNSMGSSITEGCSAAAGAAVAAGSDSSSRYAASSSEGGGSGSLMKQCLQGAVPQYKSLPSPIRHLPAVAIPYVISQHHTFTSSRTTDARKLAQIIASSLTTRGRCRICTAGGIAALNALTAVALAEYLVRKSQGKALAMHVGSKKRVEQQVPKSTDWPQVVSYYELTLLIADGDYDAAPATCVFRRGGKQGSSGGAKRQGWDQQHHNQQQEEVVEEEQNNEQQSQPDSNGLQQQLQLETMGHHQQQQQQEKETGQGSDEPA